MIKACLLNSFACFIYVTLHSYVITLDMFTIHVAMVASEESVLSFLFYNNFTEIKITVFKKVDTKGLYQYACNDSVERVQLMIYAMNIFLTTSQNKEQIFKFILIILGSEMVTDSLKHFFITKLNKLDSALYNIFRKNISLTYI